MQGIRADPGRAEQDQTAAQHISLTLWLTDNGHTRAGEGCLREGPMESQACLLLLCVFPPPWMMKRERPPLSGCTDPSDTAPSSRPSV